jgi:hypothetical protein
MRPEDINSVPAGCLLDLVYADRDLRYTYTYREFREMVEGCARTPMA